MNNQTTEYWSIAGMINTLSKWWKLLLIVTLVSILLSVIVTSPLFITPLYKSSIILYPASSNSISKSLLNENNIAEQDIMEFGKDDQTEQMLQILGSNKVRDRVIRQFDLARHYNLDSSGRYFHTRLYRRYESNIRAKRTEYMAVKITVLDQDPQMAADIANSIAAVVDSVKNEMQKDRAMRAFQIVENEYNRLKADIKVMEDSLAEIRKLGVQDYETQAEMLNQQMAIELARGNKSAINALENKFKVLAQYGGAYVSLSNSLEYEIEHLSFVKAKYDEARIDAFEYIPQKFIVQEAFKAEKKAYPVRWIAVSFSTITVLLFTSLILLLLEKNRRKTE